MFEFDPGLIIWTSISFVLLLALLYKAALPPLLEILEKRRKHIEDSLSRAEKVREDADDLLASYKKKLEQAEHKAQAIVDRARTESEHTRLEMVRVAEDEVRNLRSQIKLEAEAEKTKLLRELKDEVSNLVITATSKVLGRVITKQDQERIVKEGIDEIKRI